MTNKCLFQWDTILTRKTFWTLCGLVTWKINWTTCIWEVIATLTSGTLNYADDDTPNIKSDPDVVEKVLSSSVWNHAIEYHEWVLRLLLYCNSYMHSRCIPYMHNRCTSYMHSRYTLYMHSRYTLYMHSRSTSYMHPAFKVSRCLKEIV